MQNSTLHSHHRWILDPLFNGLMAGLALSQVLATLQVFASNTLLHQRLAAVAQNGYLPVPNAVLFPRLISWITAFQGGIFFTLTVGTSLTLVTLAAAWAWVCLGRQSRYFFAALLVVWLGGLLALFLSGSNVWAKAYWGVIPLALFPLSARWWRTWVSHSRPGAMLLHIVLAAVLLGVWVPQFKAGFFTRFRDAMLLSNPVGESINDYYYRYTLYPAEALKSMDQKLLRTSRIVITDSTVAPAGLDGVMIAQDYLPLKPPATVDVVIHAQNEGLRLETAGDFFIEVEYQDFLNHPSRYLSRLSQMADDKALLRAIVFIGLLTGFPLTVYIVVRKLVFIALASFLRPRAAAWLASVATVGMGVAILWGYLSIYAHGQDPDTIADRMVNGDRWQRVAALKAISAQRLEIDDYPGYMHSAKSPFTPERYWLARALGFSRRSETIPMLRELLNDPQINVASMAFEALGRRLDTRVVPRLKTILIESEHPYIQWYAYKTLKVLGWQQSRSL